MKIETIPSGAFATNCYIVEDQGTVLILDPTGKPQRILIISARLTNWSGSFTAKYMCILRIRFCLKMKRSMGWPV